MSVPPQPTPYPGSYSHSHPEPHSHPHTDADHPHPHPHTHSHEHEHEHEHGNAHTHDPAHDHGHVHDHAHSHEHSHEQSHRSTARAPLAAQAGHDKLLFLDAQSGIAGDMTIAALVDLGVPFSVVESAVEKLSLSGYRLELRGAHAGAIGACQFDVVIDPGQGERSYRQIDDLIAQSGLEDSVKTLARAIFRRLAEAESQVHRIPLDSVHFHEVGAVDAIVDIVGAAACFAYLGARVACSPLPLGHGFVSCRHGVLPLPAPATVACLSGVPTFDAGIEAELVTPTGAAIVATVAEEFLRWPSFAPERDGWGRGTRELPDRPNALRVVLGQPTAHALAVSGTHVVLETNVDDMSGELAAHAIRELLGAGALDAWASPITMKKGRPALTLSVLVGRAEAAQFAELLLRETSSIGVRYYPVDRVERARRLVSVSTRFGLLPVKISEGRGGPVQLKPEFDACAEAARAAGVPVREVLIEALRRAEELESDAR
ncbi:MAG TPA: nickel pincer cofactor biosynthesis protein LarC [Polyangiaceae bacterium]